MRRSITVRSRVMQTPERNRLTILDDVVITVDDEGIITAIDAAAESTSRQPIDHELGPDFVLIPGVIDTHLHAPQWQQLGTGLDLPLEDWLFQYTFPIEQRLTDPAIAAEVWPHMVSTLLAHGTTAVAYYATVDVETTTMLAATCAELGQRAFVGRVGMDHPEGTPEWYRDADAAAGIDASRRSIEGIRALASPLVQPIVTPRFTPACTDELLAGLGALAAETSTIIQTHCSESDWQHGAALERFGCSDAAALDGFELIKDHTVLAHGDHLGNDDFTLIRAAGAGVAHCPLSNAYFGNAVFPARRALDAGVRVGLGSDVAGGARPGLLPQCADAVTASRYLEDGVDPQRPPGERGTPDSRISIVEAFWMATIGGAELLGLPTGLLEVGRPFDAIAVNTRRTGSPLQAWPGLDDDARIFEKIIRLATPADISDVWVAGRRVAGSRT
jgi:guanine deaminase